MKNIVCTALMLLMSVCMYAQELYGEYEKKVYVSSQGDSLKYRLLRPEAEKAGKKYPLVLFLHGAGERGDDNQKQLVHGGQMWLNPVNREEYPAFVLAPQCPKEDYWAYVGRPKSFVPGEMPEVQEPTRIFRTLKELLDTYLADLWYRICNRTGNESKINARSAYLYGCWGNAAGGRSIHGR